MGLGDLLRQHVAARLGSQSPAQNFQAAARRRATAAGLAAGSAQPGVSSAANLRNAQRAAAQASIGADVEAARMAAAERAQMVPLAAQLAAQDQQRADRFLGAGLSAGASGLGALLSVFGGQQGPPPGTTSGIPGAQVVGPPPTPSAPVQQPMPQGAPPQPPAGAQQGGGGLSSLLGAAGGVAGTAAGGPIGGMLGGTAANVLGGVLPVPTPEGETDNPLEDLLRAMGGYG